MDYQGIIEDHVFDLLCEIGNLEHHNGDYNTRKGKYAFQGKDPEITLIAQKLRSTVESLRKTAGLTK